MKSLLMTLALVLGASSAYAQVATVATTATRVQTAVQSARVSVNPAVLNRVAAIAGAANLKVSDRVASEVSKVADQIDAVLKSNDTDKAERVETLQLVMLAYIRNNKDKNEDLNAILEGELREQAVKGTAKIEKDAYSKFPSYLLEITNDDNQVDLEDASRRITGGTLAAWRNACGSKARR